MVGYPLRSYTVYRVSLLEKWLAGSGSTLRNFPILLVGENNIFARNPVKLSPVSKTRATLDLKARREKRRETDRRRDWSLHAIHIISRSTRPRWRRTVSSSCVYVEDRQCPADYGAVSRSASWINNWSGPSRCSRRRPPTETKSFVPLKNDSPFRYTVFVRWGESA